MGLEFPGTVSQRYAYLDRRGRRCDGNNRRCLHMAVEILVVIRADGFGEQLPDAEPEEKQVCSRHRPQFNNSGFWIFLGDRRMRHAA